MPSVITAFAVPDDCVDATLPVLTHDRSRLYRGLPGHATFGLIAVSQHAALEDAVRKSHDDARRSVSALTGVYAEHDVGGQCEATAAEDDASVTFVNCLRVAAGREGVAFAAWKRVNDYMVAKPGYLSHVLYRRTGRAAAFTFVNVVRWTSADSLRAAQDAGFRVLTSDLPFVPQPSLCRLVGAPARAGLRFPSPIPERVS
jgi:heme-degrading monooxygenase HmoA